MVRRRRLAPLLLVTLLLVVVAVLLALRPWASATGGPVPGTGDTAPVTEPPGVSLTPGSSPTPGADGSPSSQPPVVVLVAGDIASCGLTSDSDTAALIGGLSGTVLAAGDLAYERGTPTEYSECYDPTWGAFRDRTLPAPGNHDWGTAKLAGYLGYWGDGAVSSAGHPWYSRDLGGWHVLMLDSDCGSNGGCDAASPEGRWLASDLAAPAASAARCTLAVWHHPRFSSGQHGNDTAVAPFWTALAAANADLVVNGHDHDYERFAPQTGAGAAAPDDGIREFVVGTGGASLRGFRTIRANSEVRLSRVHGVLELSLGPAGYTWRFLATDGTVLDHGEGACH